MRHPGSDGRATAKTWGLLVVWALVGGMVAGCLHPAGQSADLHRRPQLIVDDSVAPDFEALARETWARFLDVFQARSDCFGDVRLHATYDLNSRAVYDPDSATVTVRVPGTPAMLQSALVHEWAHHIEFQCEEQRTQRRAFLIAQGLPPDTPWRPDDIPAEITTDEWAAIPSEQFAEATVALVLGNRAISTKARITQRGVRVVKLWASGADVFPAQDQ